MKNRIQYLLQQILGFRNYCFLFSIFRIYTMQWDKRENHFLHFLRMLDDGGVVLDIGANIGIMTVKMARKVPAAKVYAVEPVPPNIQTLQRIINYFRLDNVTVFPVAMGKENRNVQMIMPRIRGANKQGLSHVADDAGSYGAGREYNVLMRRLDDMDEFKEPGIRIKAVKIDVENSEYAVLKGGEQLILKHKPLIYCELWDNANRDNTITFLKDLGYTVKVYKGKKLVTYSEHDPGVQNFFFIP